jgi:hypothetical protein
MRAKKWVADLQQKGRLTIIPRLVIDQIKTC